MSILSRLPDDLPVPLDDGAAAHLTGLYLPEISLACTDGTDITLSELRDLWVIYIYPMTGHPDTPLPNDWNNIPGARGCTPQSCSFRDHLSEIKALNADVLGLSTQTTGSQNEARKTLHLPFHLLSDHGLQLKNTIGLPAFCVDDMEFYKRITLISRDGHIEKVFYPVFPPDRNAGDVIEWLRNQS